MIGRELYLKPLANSAVFSLVRLHAMKPLEIVEHKLKQDGKDGGNANHVNDFAGCTLKHHVQILKQLGEWNFCKNY